MSTLTQQHALACTRINLTCICELLLLLMKVGGVVVGEFPPVTRETLLAALSLYPSLKPTDEELGVDVTGGGRAFNRRRFSSSLLALHSSGVFP